MFDRRLVGAMAASAVLFAAGGSAAQAPPVDTLKGLFMVEVLVDAFHPDLLHDAPWLRMLRTDVESQLRLAGIPAVSESVNAKSPQTARLYLRLRATKLDDGVYAYSLRTCLTQRVQLTDGRFTQAQTWDLGEVGAIDANRVSSLRVTFRDQVNTFIDAWLTVNFKQ